MGGFLQGRIQANQAGTQGWAFHIGSAASPDYSKVWRPYSGGQVMSYNTFIPIGYGNGARYNTGGGGADGQLNNVQSNYYYTFNVSKNPTSDNVMELLETNFNPVNFVSTSQSPLATAVDDVSAVTVSVTTAANPAAGENIFVRYTIDDFVTSSLAQFTFAGSTGTATIPAQAGTKTVKYYIFSSNRSQSGITADVGSNGAQAYDMATLNLLNNAGANYAYTVKYSRDLGATALVTPISKACYSNAETVTIRIKNYAASTIDFAATPVTVNTNVTGAVTQALSQTVNTGTLAAGATLDVTMSATLNMSSAGTYNFTAATVLTGDVNNANNTLAASQTASAAPGQWVGPSTGDWNNGTNWCAGIPTGATDVIIPAGINVTIGTADASAKSVSIANTGMLTMTSSYNLTISADGSFANSGTLNTTTSTGAILFAGVATLSGTLNFNKVEISGGVNFGTASNILANGSLTINAGGFVNSNAPSYDCASTLIYKSGGGVATPYARNAEWTNAISGAGFPGNVLITNNTYLNYPNGTSLARSICGSLTIDAGSRLDMSFGSPGTSASLTIGKNLINNGDLFLGNNTGGDLYVGGNYTRASTASFDPKGRAVFFNGAADQTVTITGGGTETFAYLGINKAAGSLLLNNSPATAVTINGTSGNVLQLMKGTVNLNGQQITLNGAAANILLGGNAVNITGTAGSTINISNAEKTVTTTGGGSLTTDPAVQWIVSTAINFGPNLTTVNGMLQLNSSSYVNINAPFYGSSSLLKYNSNTAYDRRVEWSGTVATSVGYPNDVLITNNTTLRPGGPSGTFAAIPFNTKGNVTIDPGSAIYMDATSQVMIVPMKVVGSLTISGSLSASTIAGGDVYVSGNWLRTGIFNDNDRAVFFDGTTNATLTATGGQTFPYAYLNKSGATLQLQDALQITKELGLQNGTLDLAAKDITIRSTAASTARVAAVTAAITYGTGRFIIERYLPAKKAWRFLSTPVKPGLKIFDTWQEGGLATSGNGVEITGPGALPTTNGLDVTTVSPSLKYDNGAGGFTGISNTRTTDLANDKGYMIYVRGDRNATLANGINNETVLRSKGELIVGTKNYSVPAGAIVSVGNPYASRIDMRSVNSDGGFANVTNSFTIWDPVVGGGVYGQGLYRTYTRNSTSGDFEATPGGTVNNFVESGQAFYVQSSTGGTFSLQENEKSAGSANASIAPTVGEQQRLYTNLYAVNNDSSLSLIDGTLTDFDPTYNAGIDNMDVRKRMNATENISISNEGKELIVERRGLYKPTDTVRYNISGMRQQSYMLEFESKNIALQNIAAYLQDSYLNKNTLLDMAGITTCSFTVNADAASSSTNRFCIIFKQNTILPVSITLISAARTGDKKIAINWRADNELNVSSYKIERSADAVHFENILKINATNSNRYTQYDEKPLDGVAYYRIISIGTGGKELYSNIIKVSAADQQSKFSVYPNPVKEKNIQLKCANIIAGKYELQLIHNNGQIMHQQTLLIGNGEGQKNILLGNNISAGPYTLKISCAGGKSYSLPLIIL